MARRSSRRGRPPATPPGAVPLDCDPALLDMLMRVTIKFAEADYLLWNMAKAGGLRVPDAYVPNTLLDESRQLMTSFDLDALAELQAAQARARLIVVSGTGTGLEVPR